MYQSDVEQKLLMHFHINCQSMLLDSRQTAKLLHT
jgi:hypothetical protein